MLWPPCPPVPVPPAGPYGGSHQACSFLLGSRLAPVPTLAQRAQALSESGTPARVFLQAPDLQGCEVPSGQGDLFVSPQKDRHLQARALGTLQGKERKQLGLPVLSGVPKPILVLHLAPMGAPLWVMPTAAGTAKTQKRCLQAAGELPPAAPVLRGTGAKRPRPRPHPRVTCPCTAHMRKGSRLDGGHCHCTVTVTTPLSSAGSQEELSPLAEGWGHAVASFSCSGGFLHCPGALSAVCWLLPGSCRCLLIFPTAPGLSSLLAPGLTAGWFGGHCSLTCCCSAGLKLIC